MIAFIGSVFSPYYAWRNHRDPLDHCAVNVALYGAGGRWAMTERGRDQVDRAAQELHIGPSSLRWRGDVLDIAIDEICAPIPRRVRGVISVAPSSLPAQSFQLDAQGRHMWQPIAPHARVEVQLDDPALSWRGAGYFDSNRGTEPLEAGFQDWTWSRLARRNKCVVLYDARRRDGSEIALALRTGSDGRMHQVTPPPCAAMPTTRWRLGQQGRADSGSAITVRKTLEDTPFYARSLIGAQIHGERLEGFHESLSLDRFASPVVRAMLPFRMPRRFF